MTVLAFEVDGSDALLRVIKRLEGNLDDTQPVLDEAAAILFNRTRRRFLLEQDPDSVRWPKSAAAIKREKLNRGGGTLFDTGNLFRSLQLFSVGADSRAIGTDVKYGVYHQFGTATLPKREFLGFSNEDILIAESLVLKRIEEALTT